MYIDVVRGSREIILRLIIIACIVSECIQAVAADLTCPAGNHISCYQNLDTNPKICPDAECVPCPVGKYNSKQNNQAAFCADCSQCYGPNQVEIRPCTHTADAVCGCREGFFIANPGLSGPIICIVDDEQDKIGIPEKSVYSKSSPSEFTTTDSYQRRTNSRAEMIENCDVNWKTTCIAVTVISVFIIITLVIIIAVLLRRDNRGTRYKKCAVDIERGSHSNGSSGESQSLKCSDETGSRESSSRRSSPSAPQRGPSTANISTSTASQHNLHTARGRTSSTPHHDLHASNVGTTSSSQRGPSMVRGSTISASQHGSLQHDLRSTASGSTDISLGPLLGAAPPSDDLRSSSPPPVPDTRLSSASVDQPSSGSSLSTSQPPPPSVTSLHRQPASADVRSFPEIPPPTADLLAQTGNGGLCALSAILAQGGELVVAGEKGEDKEYLMKIPNLNG